MTEQEYEKTKHMVQKFENKIRQFISQHHMIEPGGHVIAGVSGGADSMCLLLVLLHLRKECGHTVSVVHVEHGIRAQAAKMDAEFVRHFCEQEGIECHIYHYCVPQYAAEHGMSEEEAGRKLRYEAFEAEKKKYAEKPECRNDFKAEKEKAEKPGCWNDFKAEKEKYAEKPECADDNICRSGKSRENHRIKIAVAHNLGDNAETMLFHLARGTGIRGLSAIAPVRGDIIRPLLHTSREEIETYLMQAGQKFCTDATNAEDVYSRNQIRHHVLPGLHRVNSRAAEHMYQAAEQLREINSFLERQAAQELKRCCILNAAQPLKPENVPGQINAALKTEADKDGGGGTWRKEHAVIDKEAFQQADPVIQKIMLHQLITKLSGSAKNLTSEHICQVQDLFSRQVSRCVSLPYGLKAVRVYEGVEIFENEKKDADRTADDLEKLFSFQLLEHDSDSMPIISKKKYTKCFDYDKIETEVCIRTRQPGDYLAVNDSGERQKLKKYLINEKIPAGERGRLLLLADGAHIMWVIGHRMSSHYKVDEHTRRILIVTYCGGREDE